MKSLLDALYDLPTANKRQHQEFLIKYGNNFGACNSIECVFLFLNLHWNYLHTDILTHIIAKFSLQSLWTQLEVYEEQLQSFLEHTTLREYYKVEANNEQKEAPQGFIELVSKHSWEPPIYLKKIDEFRRKLARKYDLHACAVILVSMDIGSVVITMMVPESVVAMVNSTGTEFFKEHGIVHLQLNGTCVYKQASRPASDTCSNDNDIICCVFPDSLSAHITCRLKMKCLPQQCSLLLRGSLSSSQELLPQSQWLRQLVGHVSGRVMQLSQVPRPCTGCDASLTSLTHTASPSPSLGEWYLTLHGVTLLTPSPSLCVSATEPSSMRLQSLDTATGTAGMPQLTEWCIVVTHWPYLISQL